jgi:predicted PurR-regulated permease PerM
MRCDIIESIMKPPQSVSISTSTFIKAVLIVLGLWFLWFVRDVVAILVVSVLLAALIDPFADWFEEHRIPRGIAVLIVYTILIAISSVMLILLTPVVIEQSAHLVGNLGGYYTEASDSLGQFQQFSETYGLSENLSLSMQSIQDSFTASFDSVFSTVKGFFGGIAALVIIFVLAFYMVVEEDAVRKYFQSLLPPEYQPYLSHVAKKMKNKMGAWLRGQLVLGFVVGIAAYIGLKLLGIEYALLLALIAGLFEVVPYVGPIISLFPAAIIGFAQSPLLGLAVMVLYLLIQQVENNVLYPKIMQKATGLNPIVSIIALLIGIKVAGVVGAIISIPLATMGVVLLEDLFKDVG